MNTNNNEIEDKYIFTCKKCGSHDLLVVSEYLETTYYTQALSCECEESSNEIAAEIKSHVTNSYRDSGFLDDDHHWDYDEHEKIETIEDEVDDLEIYCEKCYNDADEQDWEVIEEETEIEEDDVEFSVYCAGCDREIEFGWSHPNRGGRIWAAECTDFNPWKCWPEPKYSEKWAKKNWLRPARDNH